jgi:hypothetical protein
MAARDLPHRRERCDLCRALFVIWCAAAGFLVIATWGGGL